MSTTNVLGNVVSVYGILAFAASVFFLCITTSNALWLACTHRVGRKKTGPSVAVLIPARNEALRIRPCLDSLLAQDYEPYRLYVIDDNSTDETWGILNDYKQRFPEKLCIYQSEPLPEDWYGKPHALQQLSSYANEDFLLCTDADTVHAPDSIAKAIAAAEKYRADVVTGYAHHTMPTFGEACVVPSMYILTMFAMPLYLIHSTKLPFISHAIGQFMLFRRSFLKESADMPR